MSWCLDFFLPTWQSAWGYKNLAETHEQVTNMPQANIPLEGRLRSYRYGYVFLCSSSDFPIALLIVM